MKTKLGVAIALASIAPAVSFAEPKVYGKINLAFEPVTNIGEDSHTTLISNASRLGFKGSEEVSEGLSAIYVLEYGTTMDDSSTFSQRNIYVGVEGGFGRVIAGRADTPTKMAQGKIDQFGDLRGDIAEVLTLSDYRANNTVMYSTPGESINGNVMYITRETDGADDGISASVTFSSDAIYAALAYDQDVVAEGTSNIRAVLAGYFGAFELGAMYEQADADAADDTADAMMVSAGFKIGEKTKLMAQYGQSDQIEEGGESASIGAEFTYTKNFNSYVYYTMESADDESVLDNDYLGIGVVLKI